MVWRFRFPLWWLLPPFFTRPDPFRGLSGTGHGYDTSWSQNLAKSAEHKFDWLLSLKEDSRKIIFICSIQTFSEQGKISQNQKYPHLKNTKMYELILFLLIKWAIVVFDHYEIFEMERNTTSIIIDKFFDINACI